MDSLEVSVVLHRAKQLRTTRGWMGWIGAAERVSCRARCADASERVRARIRARAEGGVPASSGSGRARRGGDAGGAVRRDEDWDAHIDAHGGGGPATDPVWEVHDSHSSKTTNTILLRAPSPSVVPPAACVFLLELRAGGNRGGPVDRTGAGVYNGVGARAGPTAAGAAAATQGASSSSSSSLEIASAAGAAGAVPDAGVLLGLVVVELLVLATENRLGRPTWLPVELGGELLVTVSVASAPQPLPAPVGRFRAAAIATTTTATAAAAATATAALAAKAVAAAATTGGPRAGRVRPAPLRVYRVHALLTKTAVGFGLSFREAKSTAGAASSEVGCVVSRWPDNAAGQALRRLATIRVGDRLEVCEAHVLASARLPPRCCSLLRARPASFCAVHWHNKCIRRAMA